MICMRRMFCMRRMICMRRMFCMRHPAFLQFVNLLLCFFCLVFAGLDPEIRRANFATRRVLLHLRW